MPMPEVTDTTRTPGAGSATGNGGRPAPYMIFRAMEATGVRDVGRVLVAGDTVRDLEAGTNAGAAIVAGALTGAQDATTLGGVRHTHLLPGVAAVPALLGLG
ncbi:hypothetical protein FAF44_32550 [Nonomuraea sp. MG754425]|uniref:HAD hydrolase-like protein n=1 Tax=Nonomuraea sp. MG754425 TaxID=2570319 RepID=UPI001F253F83|nr:HAD hydrolase-like protein [Nonomuraea sp. MG754425]MCF6473089.1 hypothetical protein [Nonomuraea sp. MG754425]